MCCSSTRGERVTPGYWCVSVQKQGETLMRALVFLTERLRGNNKLDIAHHKVPKLIQLLQLCESADFSMRGTQTQTQQHRGEGAGSTKCLEKAYFLYRNLGWPVEQHQS